MRDLSRHRAVATHGRQRRDAQQQVADVPYARVRQQPFEVRLDQCPQVSHDHRQRRHDHEDELPVSHRRHERLGE